VQRARIAFGREGATALTVRGGRVAVAGLELDSERVGAIRERIPEAIYSSREQSLTLRVPDGGESEGSRIATLEALTDAIGASRETPAPEPV